MARTRNEPAALLGIPVASEISRPLRAEVGHREGLAALPRPEAPQSHAGRGARRRGSLHGAHGRELRQARHLPGPAAPESEARLQDAQLGGREHREEHAHGTFQHEALLDQADVRFRDARAES